MTQRLDREKPQNFYGGWGVLHRLSLSLTYCPSHVTSPVHAWPGIPLPTDSIMDSVIASLRAPHSPYRKSEAPEAPDRRNFTSTRTRLDESPAPICPQREGVCVGSGPDSL